MGHEVITLVVCHWKGRGSCHWKGRGSLALSHKNQGRVWMYISQHTCTRLSSCLGPRCGNTQCKGPYLPSDDAALPPPLGQRVF